MGGTLKSLSWGREFQGLGAAQEKALSQLKGKVQQEFIYKKKDNFKIQQTSG